MRLRPSDQGCLLSFCFSGLCSLQVVYLPLGYNSAAWYKLHHVCLLAFRDRWIKNKNEQMWRDVHWHEFCARLAETTLLLFVYSVGAIHAPCLVDGLVSV